MVCFFISTMKSLIISTIAFNHFDPTISIAWNPEWWNSASIWTPCLINMVTNFWCRQSPSPHKTQSQHLRSLLMALVCGPSAIGLQYQWSQFSPSGNESSQTKSYAYNGKAWSIQFCSSDFILSMPPNTFRSLYVSAYLFFIGINGLITSPNMVIELTSSSIDKIAGMPKQMTPCHFYSMLKQMFTFKSTCTSQAKIEKVTNFTHFY